jgi:hypothetical protein
MRIDRRLVLAIAIVFVLQGVLCPAVCLAGNLGAAATQAGNAAADSEHASSHTEEPCHQGRRGAPQDVPTHGDDSPACTSCSFETPLAYTAEKNSDPPSAAVIASTLAIAPVAMGRLLPFFEPEHVPLPACLYLLNSSFLL